MGSSEIAQLRVVIPFGSLRRQILSPSGPQGVVCSQYSQAGVPQDNT
uniref:ATP binding / kinase/ protein kinase/ protein serine/threonine kinase n=1 Tax=Arundo donax TaxID=35708 RepID=A0A0A9DRI2_ARUDO